MYGAVFFIFAMCIQKLANNYVDRSSTTPVGDIFLDNLPTVNLDFLIVQGVLIISLVLVILLLANPKYLPFTFKASAVFLIIRSFFISLTHLGVNLHQISLNANSAGFGIYDFLFNSKNDFFFSGHVGVPFLLGLIFWKEKFWRYFFFITSFIFGVTMILSHMHYSIDVFASPFITYGIFIISKKLFKKDFDLKN